MPSRALPPPPPPVRLRAWPDRQTLLTDRGMALDELRRTYLAAHRLLLLWLCAFGGVIGWALLVQPFQLIEDKDPLTFVFGPVFVILGLAALAPAVVGVVLGMRRDRHIRELADAWAALDTDPAADARLRSPGASLTWCLSSLVVCALGLWASLGTAAYAEPGRDTYVDVTFGMGAGIILWLTGLIGIRKALGHYRWAVRRLSPATARSGAHR
ncbi:hypothetical protein AB0M68_15495 [Streptomyces sp. NPDC051453]|uniref:hypothetical protein n=1 Tax=Streptomyces sp. NPDC051453 TaxID=3154941 RepID=UPI003418B32C